MATVEGMRIYNATLGKWLLQNPVVAIIKDVKNIGAEGGTNVAGVWQTRDLNTLDDPYGIVGSLSANQFTLPIGRYLIEASVPSYRVGEHKSALYNVTNNAYFSGTNAHSLSTMNSAVALSVISNYVTVTAPSNLFEIRQITTQTGFTNAFGLQIGGLVAAAENELYTQVKITKLE